MKIVYVYPQFAPRAGTERILIEKMNYLSEQAGNEVVMLTYEQGPHPVAFELSPKVKHIDLNVRYYPLFRHSRIVRFCRWALMKKRLQKYYNTFMDEYRPDIVVCTTYYENIISMMVACPTPAALVLESHIDKRFILSNDPENQQTVLRWLHNLYHMKVIQRKARHFDVLVSLSQEDANEWSQYVKKTAVITNIVHLNDTNRYSSQKNKKCIFVGRYVEQKGIPDLFKIWQLVHKKHPDWQLDLYGEGNLYEQTLAEADNLQANIHVHKSDNDIFERYLDSSLFLLTSIYEPFGLVMPEAMSCGLPVVAFNCPSGPARIITDGTDGFLIPERDIQLYAEKVCTLIEDEDLRKRMSKAAIQSSQRFSTKQIMAQWESLFHELCSQRSLKQQTE